MVERTRTISTPFRSCWAGASGRRAGDHGHVVVGGERLAELGEQVGGRLDTGPVVLVQNENALTAHGRTGYPRDQADRELAADRSDRLEPVTAGTGTAALTSTAVTDIAVLGPDPGFGGGGAAQLEAFLVAAAALGRTTEIHYGRMPSRRRPVDAANQFAFGRKVAPRLRDAHDVWVVATSAANGYAAALSGRPYCAVDRHRARGGMGGKASRPAPLAPPGDQGQRPGAAEDGAARAGRRTARVRDLAVQPRQRRPRRPPRRGRGRDPAAAGRPRALQARARRRLAGDARRSGARLRRPCERSAQERRTAARRAAATPRRTCAPGRRTAGRTAARARAGHRRASRRSRRSCAGGRCSSYRRTRRASGSSAPRRWRPGCRW